MPELEKI
jgi:dynein heavy chain, axonemal